MNAQDIFQKFKKQHIVVLGDVMIDRYLTGIVTRISPEAPVPVVLQEDTVDHLGGAANVALNIDALGATPILCSVVGRDTDGMALREMVAQCSMTNEGLVFSDTRKTTVKTRILGNNHQMLRIDREDDHELSDAEAGNLVRQVYAILENQRVDAIIFQDYNKGVLTPAVIAAVLDVAQKRKIITAVDPKKNNFFAYRGVDLFKPNLKEIRDSVPFAVQAEKNSLQAASAYLRERLGQHRTMITLSEKGLFLENKLESGLYPTLSRKVADVSGAGDTVISIATLALVAKLDLSLIAALSNLAGGQVCEYPGVVPVRLDILRAELDHWLNSD